MTDASHEAHDDDVQEEGDDDREEDEEEEDEEEEDDESDERSAYVNGTDSVMKDVDFAPVINGQSMHRPLSDQWLNKH